MKMKEIKDKSMFDKFSKNRIATLIFVVSVGLSYFLGGGLWYLFAFFSLMWIIFRNLE